MKSCRGGCSGSGCLFGQPIYYLLYRRILIDLWTQYFRNIRRI
jgi:hypothetical protein